MKMKIGRKKATMNPPREKIPQNIGVTRSTGPDDITVLHRGA